MPLVSNPVDALYNGVSQQPAAMRLPSQCEEQINGYASVADGLSKRPPTEHLAKLSASAFGSAFIHIINRDVTERYAVVVTDEVLKVYDLSDGSEQTVIHENTDAWAATTAKVLDEIVRPGTPDGNIYRCTTAGDTGGSEPTWDTTIGNTTADGTVTWTAFANYLAIPDGANASESFEMVTVADYSFLVNKTRTVLSRATGYATPAGFNKWYFPDNWREDDSDTRYYYPVAGTDKGKKQTLEDLPTPDDPSPPSANDFYEITGASDSGFSRYYVIYIGGVWQETHAHNSSECPDESTMPHALVRESDGDFHVREFGWVPRLFGDPINNPHPTFIGKKIRDLGYHRNRLIFCAGENIIMSGAGDYGNFYRNTVTQLLDSDVVDVAVSTAQVAEVNYLLPAENGLMFFSDQMQFVLNVDRLLTPSTASIDVATSYEMNQYVKPISVGQDVYYVTETGDYSRVREYSLSASEDIQTSALDVTAHVPRYLPKGIRRLAGSSNEDIMLAISSETGFDNRVYLYKFFYANGKKVQSAWSYWLFADDDIILDVNVLNNKIYFVIERADGVYLEIMNVQSTDFPLALTYDLLIDRRYNFAGGDKSYDASDTTFTLPYTLTSGEQDDFRLILGDGATAGRVLDTTGYTWVDSDHVKFAGDWTAVEVFGGLNYTFEYEFSQQFNRRRDGMSVTTGRYQLRTFTIVFENMAFFNTEVDPYGDGNGLTEDIVTKGLVAFTGKTLGAGSLLIDSPTFEDGTYDFQIYGNSKVAVVKLTNDQPFGGTFVSATVEGFYTNRGR